MANHVVSLETLEPVLKFISSKGFINDVTPNVDLFNLDYFEQRIDRLIEAFPEKFFVHAAAIKANPIRGILQEAKRKGLGAECASISEVVHALNTGFEADKVVFDSPCKSKYDIEKALQANVTINLDNDYEMELVDDLLKTTCKDSKSVLGLRVNPVVGGGSIAIVSTATKLSKFGIPITKDTKAKVVELYQKYQWLNGIHIHVGSQGVPLELFIRGAKTCMDMVKAIETARDDKLAIVDIGGGLSTSYTHDFEPDEFSFLAYRKRLERAVPELFSGQYTVVTEFGQSLFLKAGTSVTRIEHVKRWIPGVKLLAMTHIGVNQFIRETYRPETCQHRFALADKGGNVKEGGETEVYDISGPMCFQGDYISKDVELPKITPGDWLLIRDTGAYTMAMYSKWNSILPSPVYGYRRNQDGRIRLWCLKERETYQEGLKFWGREVPRKKL